VLNGVILELEIDNQMKKISIMLAALFSFSTLAASENSLRFESSVEMATGNSNKSISSSHRLKSDSNREQYKKVEVEGVSISRRTAVNKVRDNSQSTKMGDSKIYREQNPKKSTTAFGFQIFDSWVSLDSDLDNDGYYSGLTVNFDADYEYGYAEVYAKIYLSYEGGDWFQLYSSEDFSIYGNESDDYYSVSLDLNYDIPTGEYDLLIDLYQVGYSDIVATAAPEDDYDLYGLLLEDYEHESSTYISYVASELYTDRDHDGYYTQLTLEYDLDTFDTGRSVYAEVDIINTETHERVIVSTVDFILGNQTEFIDIDFSSGYVSSYYDFEIRIFDAYSNMQLALASQEFSALNYLPVESEEYDQPEVSVDVHVHGGGGSFSWAAFSILLAAGIKRAYRLKLVAAS